MKFFDSGSGLLALWIGVPVRQIHVENPTWYGHVTVSVPVVNSLRSISSLFRGNYGCKPKTETAGRYTRSSGLPPAPNYPSAKIGLELVLRFLMVF